MNKNEYFLMKINFKFDSAVNLNKCLSAQILCLLLTCASYSELPSNINEMIQPVYSAKKRVKAAGPTQTRMMFQVKNIASKLITISCGHFQRISAQREDFRFYHYIEYPLPKKERKHFLMHVTDAKGGGGNILP